jgi:broad specificity phosphatase PhoE
MDLRLLLISHASTAAQRAGRIPSSDADAEPLDARGIAETEAARARLALPHNATVLVSPAACARETASALELVATTDPGLADMNYGHWQGRKLMDIANDAPHDLAAWTRDPNAAPHGGESFSQLVIRVGAWLDALDGAATQPLEEDTSKGTSPRSHTIIAITHAPLLRAAIVHALGAAPDVFPRIEIAPLSMVELRRSQRGWTWWPALSSV